MFQLVRKRELLVMTEGDAGKRTTLALECSYQAASEF